MQTRPPSVSIHRPELGQAGIAVLFWIFGVSLFVLPFVRPSDAPRWDAPDPTRKVALDADDADDAVLDIPFEDDVAEFDVYAAEEDLGLEMPLAEWVADASQRFFGMDSEALARSGLVEIGRLETGEREYVKQCAGCHGLTGDGAGPAARFLQPRPRNFRKGLFKFVTTGNGARPLRSDLYRTVTRGLSGASMPPFDLLPEGKRQDIVEYVRYIAMRGEFEQLMLDLAWDEDELPDADEAFEIVASRWDSTRLRPLFPTVAESPADADSVARGKVLFQEPTRATCFTCHGASGRGDGPSAGAYVDGWGYPIRPRDLTKGVFRAGAEGKDLWLTIAGGIGGTPMPGYESALTGEEIWDLVHYVQFLAAGQAEEATR